MKRLFKEWEALKGKIPQVEPLFLFLDEHFARAEWRAATGRKK
jgi:hypothetical protein